MKTNHVSKIKNEDRWFKKRNKYLKREQMLPTDLWLIRQSCPFISNYSPFLFHMLIQMKNWICGFCFVFFLNNPVIIQMVKSACLVQMDPCRSIFKDYGERFFHHKPKLLKLKLLQEVLWKVSQSSRHTHWPQKSPRSGTYGRSLL